MNIKNILGIMFVFLVSFSFAVAQNETACTDSDGGENIYVAGDAQGADGKGAFDYCTFLQSSKGVLMEAVCSGSSAVHTETPCPSEAQYCNRAICSSTPPICKDTDGGNAPYVGGTITEPRLKEGPEHTDYCQNIDTKQPWDDCKGDSCGIREYYCTDPYVTTRYQDISCPNGCQDGACVEKKSLPDFIIAVDDKAPASDVILISSIANSLKDAGYSDLPVGASKLFSEVNALSLHNQITLAISNNEAVIIVGVSTPTSYPVFATELGKILATTNVKYQTMLSNEMKSTNLMHLFRTGTCTDSDEGKNYYVKGTTQGLAEDGSPSSGTDYCGQNIVYEYYCSGLDVALGYYNCPNGCRDGACIKTPTETCTDSDGGKNYYVKGYVYSTVGPQAPESGWDGCLDDNLQSNAIGSADGTVIKAGTGTKLSEVFCNENKMYESEIIDCPNGCYDGACIKEECAKEGEYTSGAVAPEYYKGCCEGLVGFDTHPSGWAGGGLLCYDPDKGTPVCRHTGTGSEGWYYSETGELLRYEECASTTTCVDKCGNGVCDETVCEGTGCPCPETAGSCPQDCSIKPREKETLYIDYRRNTPQNPVKTANYYKGTLTITVSGTGTNSGTSLSDAFYIFTDYDGNQVEPFLANEFQLYIDGKRASELVNAPAYNDAHKYTFSFYIGNKAKKLAFSQGDAYIGDNSGSITVEVSGEVVKEDKCRSDSDCKAFFSHCSCSWTCVKRSEATADCERECPYEEEISPICSCVDGSCTIAKRECKTYVDEENCEITKCNDGTVTKKCPISKYKYVHLGEKFSLREREEAKVIDYRYMKIKLNDVRVFSCPTNSQCPLPLAQLTIEMPGECVKTEVPETATTTSTAETPTSTGGGGCTSQGTEILLSEGQSKEVFGASITALGISHNSAALIVRKSTVESGVKVEIEPKEQTIGYGDKAVYKVKISDQHGKIACSQVPCEVGKPCPTCEQAVYTYFIKVQNLPFSKVYPNRVELEAGGSKSFELIVRPYEVEEVAVDEKQRPTRGITSKAVETITTKTVVSKPLKAVAVSKTEAVQTIEASSSSGGGSGGKAIREKKAVVVSPSVSLIKRYKFSVTATLKNNYNVQDTASAVLAIKPKLPTPPTPPPFPGEKISIKLHKGWNLISLPGKLIKFESIGSKKLIGFVYIKEEQKYVSLNEAEKLLGDRLKEYLAKNAFWVYTKSPFTLNTWVDRKISFEELELVKGWSLVPITEDMVGGYLTDVLGDCSLEKMHLWDPKSQKWEKITIDYSFSEYQFGYGFLVKARSYCRLTGPEIAPPPMPE